MQKKLIALAVAGLASTAAFAQSNVTVYGVADVGYVHANASGKKGQSAIESGVLSGSRLGVKGSEDLGNGLKAIFTLEYALAMDDNTGVGAADAAGTTTALFSGTAARQQFVGLNGGFGTVVAGRLQTAAFDWACTYDPLAGSYFDALSKLAANNLLSCGSAGRVNNAVGYVSPSFGGLTVAYNHARLTEDANLTGNNASIVLNADNTVTQTAATRTFGTGKDSYANILGATYANGPISVGAVYTRVDAKQTNESDNIKEWGLGGSYDLGVAKLFASYQTVKNEFNGSGRDKKYSLSATVPVGVGSVVATIARNKLDNNAVANDDSTAYSLAYLHNLSKRTTAYAGYSRVTNESGASKGIIVGSNAAGNFMAPNADGSASVYGFGVRHSF